MNRTTVALVLSAVLALAALVEATAARGSRDAGLSARARLTSAQEVPAIIADGGGLFRAKMSPKDDVLHYALKYETEGTIAQAHIHVGQPGVNGGVAAFLCSNLGNGPAGTPACPDSPGEISGEIAAADVVGPAAQGVDPGDLRGLVNALRRGVAYINVHTDIYPSGELRGQVRTGKPDRRDRDD